MDTKPTLETPSTPASNSPQTATTPSPKSTTSKVFKSSKSSSKDSSADIKPKTKPSTQGKRKTKAKAEGSSSDDEGTPSKRKNASPRVWQKEEDAILIEIMDKVLADGLSAAVMTDQRLAYRGLPGIRSRRIALMRRLSTAGPDQ